MNIQHAYQFALKEKHEAYVTFYNEESQMLAHIYVLEQDLFRVLFEKHEGLQLPTTWSIAPGQSDVELSGRPRKETAGFSCPTYSYHETDSTFEVSTDSLKATIEKEGFRITWSRKETNEWTIFAEDRETQAYNYNGELGSTIKHYLRRDITEQYFGLGERTGSLNRHHGRYRNITIDAMGYDAQFSDPLYKHIPFYITRNPKTGF